jgi:hypothetical protein
MTLPAALPGFVLYPNPVVFVADPPEVRESEAGGNPLSRFVEWLTNWWRKPVSVSEESRSACRASGNELL